MKKLSLLSIILLGITTGLYGMDAPEGWNSPQLKRPTGVYGTSSSNSDYQTGNSSFVNPLYRSRGTQVLFTSEQQTPSPVDNTRNSAPGISTPPPTPLAGQIPKKPLPKIPNKPLPPLPATAKQNVSTPVSPADSATSSHFSQITPKEREHLDKIKKELDEITDKLIELGWLLAPAGASLITFNPQGAITTLSSPEVASRTLKVGIILANITKHTIALSRGSHDARLELKKLLPRLSIISSALVKAPGSIQNGVKTIIEVIKTIAH